METGNCHCHFMVGPQSSKPMSKRSSMKKKSTNTAAAFKNKDEFQIHISEQLDQFGDNNNKQPASNKSSTRKKKNVKIHLLSDLSVSSSNNSLSESSEASDSDLPSLKMNKFAKGKTRTGTNTTAPKTTSEDAILNNIIYEAIDEAQSGDSQQPRQQQQHQQQTDHSMVNSIIDFLKFISPDIVGVISNNKAPKLANAASSSSSTDVNNSLLRNFFLFDNNLVKLDEPKRQFVRGVFSQESQSSSSSNRTNYLNLIKLFIFLFGNFCQDQQNNNNNDDSQNGHKFNNLSDLFFNFMVILFSKRSLNFPGLILKIRILE